MVEQPYFFCQFVQIPIFASFFQRVIDNQFGGIFPQFQNEDPLLSVLPLCGEGKSSMTGMSAVDMMSSDPDLGNIWEGG